LIQQHLQKNLFEQTQTQTQLQKRSKFSFVKINSKV
jgi:hypothetical protein